MKQYGTDLVMPDRLLGCFFGASGGSSSGSSNQVVNPDVFPMLKQNAARAQGIADSPFKPYTQPMTAGLTQMQQDVGGLLSGNNRNAGMDAMQSGVNAAQSATGDIMGGIAKYQSPYTNDVVNATQADIERQRQMAVNQGGADATRANAFGGARQGVSDSLTNEAALRTSAQSSAQLRDQGFQTAAGLAGNDANRNLQAGGVLGQLGQAQGNQFLNVTNAMNQWGSQAQQTNQSGLTAQLNEFLRQAQYAPDMQQLLNQAYGLVPGALGTSSKQSGWNAGFSIAAPK